MNFKIEIPEEMIKKMIDAKLAEMGMMQKESAKSEPISAESGSFFKVVIEAAKRAAKDKGVRTGIRFKLGNDTIETSLNTSSKAEATEILKKYGVSISKFCNAALEIIIAEHKAIEESKGKKSKKG